MGVFEDAIVQSSRKQEGLPGVLERRRTKRLPMLRASRSDLTSHLWDLELIPAFGLVRLVGDIEALTARSLENNTFFEADMVRSAWPRLTSLLAPHGCWMLCLWETVGETRYLRLFMPVKLEKTGFPRRSVLQVLSNEYMPIGTPLVDAECAGEAAETLMRLLADPALNIPPVVDFTHQIRDGETFGVLRDAVSSLGLKHAETLSHTRAALFADKHRDSYPRDTLTKKSLKEYGRLLRRLGEEGKLVAQCARDPEDVLDAFEAFLTLELRGWKGRRGTALYNQKKIAAFSRQIVVELATLGRCEIHSFLQDGKLVSSLILFHRDGKVTPWKIAFDESLARFSPGVQIVLHATRDLLDRPDFVFADSLAHEHHRMINRLWPDRIAITDLAVQVAPSERNELASVVESKERLHRWKNQAKILLGRY